MDKYADGINGKHVTAHTMRKSTATNAIKAGADIQTVADMLGHNSVTTTQRYAAVLEQNKQNVTNALDNLF
jgi:site-specific recombinase XerD